MKLKQLSENITFNVGRDLIVAYIDGKYAGEASVNRYRRHGRVVAEWYYSIKDWPETLSGTGRGKAKNKADAKRILKQKLSELL